MLGPEVIELVLDCSRGNAEFSNFNFLSTHYFHAVSSGNVVFTSVKMCE